MAKHSVKSEGSTKKDTTNSGSFGNWLARVALGPKLLTLLALAALGTIVVPLAIEVLPSLSDRPEFRLRTSEIVYSEPPQWVSQDLLQQVVEMADLPPELSMLQDDLAEEISRAFAMHPWVAKVNVVRKSIPARVEVEVEYRRPVAMVQVDEGVYPVDSQGTLLPPADFSVADTNRFLVIQNVRSSPQGAAGTNWGDLLVAASAQLADALAADWQDLGLVGIRVPKPEKAKFTVDDLIFELATAGGSTIIWGRIPGSNHPGELTSEQKIGRLKKYLVDFDSFDQPHGPYEIDIRHWQEISRRPLSARDSRVELR